jgi:predicted oxidoreductase
MMDADQVAAAFRELKVSGKVRHFGVSNFKPFQLTLLQSRLDFPLATNQIELNPLCLDSLHDGTLDQAQELNMSPMIWSPLAGGRLFSTNQDEKCSRVQKILKSLAARYNVSVDQLM